MPPSAEPATSTAASSRVGQLAMSKPVVLKGDATQDTRDRYGRLLAYVWIPGGRDLGYQLISGGFAKVYVFRNPFQRLSAYRNAESVARTGAVGQWKLCGNPPATTPLPVTPPPVRRHPSRLHPQRHATPHIHPAYRSSETSTAQTSARWVSRRFVFWAQIRTGSMVITTVTGVSRHVDKPDGLVRAESEQVREELIRALPAAAPSDETGEAASSAARVAAVPAQRKRSRWRLAFATLALLLLLAAVGAAGTVAYMNDRRADDWQQRAETLERNAAELNELLVERSADLNERTRDLNSTAKSLREARSALTRSESDVASLARRQRQLANEKAQVEDEREQLVVQQGALEGVAGAYVSCNSGLLDLVGAVARDDWAWVDYYYGSVQGDCTTAGDALDSYLNSYSGE